MKFASACVSGGGGGARDCSRGDERCLPLENGGKWVGMLSGAISGHVILGHHVNEGWLWFAGQSVSQNQ